MNPNLPHLYHEMIPVKGGTFMMGDEKGDLWEACRPVHRVTVSDFHIGKYPVTQALWKHVMGNNPSYFKGDRRPVERVSWDDAQLFISKLNEGAKGFIYRLPTEAEWEYAARGGAFVGLETDNLPSSVGRPTTAFSGSNLLDEVGWYDDNSHGETKPVGLKLPNELGIYDIIGNVWEWCNDWFDEEYYQQCHEQGMVIDPKGPEKARDRVRRGGGWYDHARLCRVANRFPRWSDRRYRNLGFRLVLVPQSVGYHPVGL